MLTDDNLNQFLKYANTDSKEAARNIDNANYFDIDPDTYKRHREDLEPDAEAAKRSPATVEPSTKEYIGQSTEHASLVKNDIDKLNWFEKTYRYSKERIVDIPNLRRDKNELILKKLIKGDFEEGDREQLEDLRFMINDMQSRTYGIDNDVGEFMVDVASGIGDLGRAYWENKEIVAGSVGTGAAIVGLAGLATPVPGGAGAGVTIGAGKGFVVGSGLAFAIDAFEQVGAETWDELDQAVDDQGNPLNIDDDSKRRTALGVAAISGSVGFLGGFALTKANPLLKRFASGKAAAAYVTKSPAVMAKMKVLGGIIQSAAAEGSEEALQEVIQIAGVNIGKADDSEGSFLNAINKTITDAETWKQAGYSGLVGVGVGSSVAGATAPSAYAGMKRDYKAAQETAQNKARVLNKQNQIIEMATLLNSSEVKNLSPAELNSYKELIASSEANPEEIYFALEDLREFADDETKRKKLRDVIDPTGQLNNLSNELNTPISLTTKEVLDIAEDFPEFTDYLKLEPLGETAAQVRTEAQDYVSRIENAETRRQEMLDEMGVGQELSPEQQAEIDQMINPAPLEQDVPQDQNEFFEDIRFEPIEGVVDEVEVQELNTIELDARLEVAQTFRQEVEEDFDRIENRIFRDVNTKDIKTQIEKLDREYRIIDTVKNEKNPIKIDPESLNPEQRRLYYDQKDIRKKINQQRKVFEEGGIHVNEAAVKLGLDSPDELLQVLAETPSKTQIRKQREQREIELRNRVRQTVRQAKLDATDKAFTNITKARLRQMNILASKEYPTLRRGMVKIAGRPPKAAVLRTRAEDLVNNMKVGQIKPKKFEAGEIRSRQKASKAWGETKFEEAYRQLEASALNNELRRSATIAQQQIARNKRFWDRVNSESNTKALQDSGYLEAMNEFRDLFNLRQVTNKNKNRQELENFQKFVKENAQDGNFVPVIPERLNDIRMSADQMTYQQYQAVTEMGQFILHKAKLKNKLEKAAKDRIDANTAEKAAARIEEVTTNDPRYDKKKRREAKEVGDLEKIGRAASTLTTLVNNIPNTVFELDGFKEGGLFHELFGKPMQDSLNDKRRRNKLIAERLETIATSYGIKNFRSAINNVIHVPEFEGRFDITDGEGRVTKIDLMIMMANLGDPDGRRNLENFVNEQGDTLPLETITAVLDRELNEADAAFVQSFFIDSLRVFSEETATMHKRTTGSDAKMIEGVPFVHRGKEYPGGYFPQTYVPLADEVKAGNFLTDFAGEQFEAGRDIVETLVGTDKQFHSRLRAAEMTDQGRLKMRTGSKRALDLNYDKFFRAIEEINHDLAYRETGIEMLKLVKDGNNSKHMKSIIGEAKYVNFVNSIKDVLSKSSDRESSPLFGKENSAITRLIDKGHMLHAIKVLGLNFSSTLIQPVSLANLVDRAGPKTAKYLAKAAYKIATNPMEIETFRQEMNKVNSDIGFEADGIDDTIIKDRFQWVPAKKRLKGYRNMGNNFRSRIQSTVDQMKDFSFFALREMDSLNRLVATMALTEQYLNGDLAGTPKEMLDSMSDAEKAKRLSTTVQQLTRVSLTASSAIDKTPLEKNKAASIFVRYFTDRRSRLNTLIAKAIEAKGLVKQKEYAEASSLLLRTAMASAISQAYINAVRAGFVTTGIGAVKAISKAFEDEEDALELVSDLGIGLVAAPVSEATGLIPFIDNISYAATKDSRSDYRQVSMPIAGVMTDVASGVHATSDMLDAMVKFKNPLNALSNNQEKLLLHNMGYIIGGFPTNAVLNLTNALNSSEARKVGRFFKDYNQNFVDRIDAFKEAFGDDKDEDVQQFIQDLEQYRDEVVPQEQRSIDEIIPEEMSEKLVEGNWDYFNPDTTAAGKYGFTEDRWNELMEIAPELGLTENGRVSKDTSEQEAAIKWEIEDTTRGLMAYDIPVNSENIYGSVKFGFSNFEKIYNAKDSAKLNSVLEGDEKNNPVFDEFETVKDIKDYIKKQIN